MGAAGTLAGLAGAASTPDPLLAAMNRLNRLADVSIGAALDGYEALIADLGTSYSAEPVARLYTRLDGLLSTVEGIIEAGPSGPYLRRLHSVAGWCAGLLGNALHDMGDPASARMNVSLGLEYGRLAHDARLLAYLRDRQVLFAVDAGRWAEALDLARAGLAVAPARTAIGLRLRSAEARQLGRLGRRDEAMVALHALQGEYEALPTSELGEGSFSVSTVFLDGVKGAVLDSLGQLAEAERHLRAIVGYYAAATGPDRRPTRLAGNQLTLALVLVRAGRPDEAGVIAKEALTTDRLVVGVLRRAGQIEAALTERYPSLPEARDFQQRYRALEATTQASAEN